MIKEKITLFTESEFDSSHWLRCYNGKCANIHGHTWLLQIWIQGLDSQKDDVGILFDFGNIKKIVSELDHTLVNSTVSFFEDTNPTAENLSYYILNKLLELNGEVNYRVRIYETAVLKHTWCQRETNNFEGSLL